MEEKPYTPLQAVSNVIELKPDKKYLLVLKGGISYEALEQVTRTLKASGIKGVGIVLDSNQELQVVEVAEREEECISNLPRTLV